jgi:hemolysin D
MEPSPQSNTASFDRSRIAIDGVSQRDVPANFYVAPGMPVEADVKVGMHTVLNYPLGRVLTVASEGMRESSPVRRIRGPCAA